MGPGRGTLARAALVAAILIIALAPSSLARTPAQALRVAPVSLDPQSLSIAWGSVVARRPTTASYTPAAIDRGNSKSRPNTVRRLGKGHYVVTYPGIGTASGIMHVSAMNTKPRLCYVVTWGPGGAGQQVELICVNGAGHRSDTRFVASFLVVTGTGGAYGYLWANDPAQADYTPTDTYQYNSTGSANTIHRVSTGIYEATLPGIDSARGNVQLSPYGQKATCRATSVSNASPDTTIRVACRNLAGAPLDTRFDLTYTFETGLKGLGKTPVAYFTADQPSTGSYVPDPDLRYSSANRAPRVDRTSRGVYVGTLRGMPAGGAALATGFGPTTARCQISSIRTSGTPQKVGVRCFKPSGAPADTQFELSYLK